jgi:voltage-gated potassium channel
VRALRVSQLKTSFYLLIITILFGISGYSLTEDLDLFESLYMTIITISTVGFMEVKPLSVYGRSITLLLIIFGITNGAYAIGTFIRMFIEGELKKNIWRKKVEKKILKLKGHFIICGFGRIGSLICRELEAHSREFVVIENDPEAIEQLEGTPYLYLPLDASIDDSLLSAGIMEAKGLVTAVRSDADNVFITLTAKGLRPDIFVLSRASNERNEVKLLRAGASRVVSPYLMGGRRMAQVLIRPTVVDFMDIAVTEGVIGLKMEEVMVSPHSNLVGMNLVESNLRKDYGVIIVLIKKHHGEMIFNPMPNEVLDANDVLVMLGKVEDMKRMNEII